MRSLHWLLPFLAWVPLGSAQSSDLLALLSQLPTCAQTCLATSLSHTSCAPTDSSCLCTDEKFNTAVTDCVVQACTPKQALSTKNATATSCHLPIRSKSESARISNLVLSPVTASFALSRLLYKAIYASSTLEWDDYSVFAALIAGVPSVILIDRGLVANGLGKDTYTLPFQKISNFARYLYVAEVLYFLEVALLKLTLLLFFLRIFPKRATRRLLWATVAFNGLIGALFVFISIFQCTPISYNWTNWTHETTGKCLNINALVWSNAIVSIALDFWMLALPLYEIFQLQLMWRKKVSIAVMFCVGTFVTVVSILRLSSVVQFANSRNPTWDQTNAIKWSNIECSVGIICACLPTLRVILVKFFPALTDTTRKSPSNYGYGSQSGNTRLGRPSRARSAILGGQGNMMPPGSIAPNSITCTKTLEVHHTDNDETSLVQMEEYPIKAKTSVSSAGSVSSL